MKRKLVGFTVFALFCFGLFSGATPAAADHGWKIVGLACSSQTIYMTIFEDASTNTSVDPNIDVNGVYLKSIGDLDPFNVNNGTHVYTDADSHYVDGATVRVYNTNGSAIGGPSSVSAVCGGGNPGPQVPAGFTLHQIDCTVSVFAEPDLNFPTSARIIQGQRWYISEKSIIGKDGQKWTEVFDAGYSDGFIPTRCVGVGWAPGN